jgi:hypothetical protein
MHGDQYLKPLIKKTFRIIQKNIDLNLKIIEISEIRNLETIRLTFGYLNSGLFVEKKKHNQDLFRPWSWSKRRISFIFPDCEWKNFRFHPISIYRGYLWFS